MAPIDYRLREATATEQSMDTTAVVLKLSAERPLTGKAQRSFYIREERTAAFAIHLDEGPLTPSGRR
jgi:hypothetical protein